MECASAKLAQRIIKKELKEKFRCEGREFLHGVQHVGINTLDIAKFCPFLLYFMVKSKQKNSSFRKWIKIDSI